MHHFALFDCKQSLLSISCFSVYDTGSVFVVLLICVYLNIYFCSHVLFRLQSQLYRRLVKCFNYQFYLNQNFILILQNFHSFRCILCMFDDFLQFIFFRTSHDCKALLLLSNKQVSEVIWQKAASPTSRPLWLLMDWSNFDPHLILGSLDPHESGCQAAS